MDIPDWFLTITDVAIGLAGFSGLVVALRRGEGPLSDIQKFRMGVLFGMAFGALFLSLVPNLLADIGLDDGGIWQFASLAMITWSMFFMYMWISRSRQVSRTAPEIFDRRAFIVMTVGHVTNLTLQFSVALAVLESNAAGVFGAGLLWYLVHGSQQFVRMLFIQPKVDHHKDDHVE